MNENTIIGYHYIRNLPKTKYPNIKGMLTRNFEKQIKHIKKNNRIISIEEYAEEHLGKTTILTFEDGFKDHHQNALPILKKLGVPGTIYPITKPIQEKNVLNTHKIHFLLAKLGTKKLSNAYNKELQKYPKLEKEYSTKTKPNEILNYRWDTPATANLKYKLTTLPEKQKNEILTNLFKKNIGNEQKFSEELYLNLEEIKELNENKITTGCHTKTHPLLTKLSQEQQEQEITQSKEWLEKNTHKKITSFSYPYGNYNQETIKILRKNGFRTGITTRNNINTEKTSLFELNRKDTNDIPYK